jgi:hypothetical protein
MGGKQNCPVIPRSCKRRGIPHCLENTQSEIPPPRCAQGRNDNLGAFFRGLLDPLSQIWGPVREGKVAFKVNQRGSGVFLFLTSGSRPKSYLRTLVSNPAKFCLRSA